MGEPETEALRPECTASTSGSVLGSPRRGSILVMELHQKVPRDDKFDVVGFLRRQLETCTSEMKAVIEGSIKFLEVDESPNNEENKKRDEECAASLQK